jgi:nitrite reductase/ring-hydroxylating ferredoxin subunit
MAKEIIWHKIIDDKRMLPFKENNMCVVSVNGKNVTISKYQSILSAFSNKCPHSSGIMSDGYLNAKGEVVCPLHRYAFNTINGRNTTGEGYYIKTYKIEEREDGVYLGIEKSGIFG